MKNRLLLVLGLCVVALSGGCASASHRATARTWNSAEIVGLVSAHPQVRHDWMVRSMHAVAPGTVVVVMADVGESSPERQRVIVQRQMDGTWQVVKVENFTGGSE